LAARWGGEEFAVLLPMADVAEAKIVADKIRLGVFGLKIPHKSSKIAGHVTISLGLATLRPGVNDNLSRLVQMADEALYRAKEAGRNRVEAARTDADRETV
jgi:diguanylate cyclase (GGDEF)-like protein